LQYGAGETIASVLGEYGFANAWLDEIHQLKKRAVRGEAFVAVSMKKKNNWQLCRTVSRDQRANIVFESKIVAALPARAGFERILRVNDQQRGLFDRHLIGIEHEASPCEFDAKQSAGD
jgi:hypothetical protein